MSRLVSELPLLIFRLAMVAVLGVSLGGLLVIAGASWHTALFWASRAALAAAVVVLVIWLLRSVAKTAD